MKETSHNDVITEVNKCVRCGKNHRVHFKPFKKKGATFTHWGECPNTNEPILMFISKLGEKHSI